MSDLADELYKKCSYLDGCNYQEVSFRLRGIWEWVNSQPDLRSIVDKIIEDSKAIELVKAIANASDRNRGRCIEAKNELEIAGVTFFLLERLLASKDLEMWQVSTSIGIREFNSSNAGDHTRCFLSRYFDHAIDYLVQHLSTDEDDEIVAREQNQIPLNIADSVKKFKKDHPDSRKAAFVMMRFSPSEQHKQIFKAIESSLSGFGIKALRADTKEYHEEVFSNIQTYMHGCSFGIAVFERVEQDDFNPNVSLEVGYMLALKKPLCLLKDQTLRSLHSDLVSRLYRSFDTHNASSTIQVALSNWLDEKGIIYQ